VQKETIPTASFCLRRTRSSYRSTPLTAFWLIGVNDKKNTIQMSCYVGGSMHTTKTKKGNREGFPDDDFKTMLSAEVWFEVSEGPLHIRVHTPRNRLLPHHVWLLVSWFLLPNEERLTCEPQTGQLLLFETSSIPNACYEYDCQWFAGS